MEESNGTVDPVGTEGLLGIEGEPQADANVAATNNASTQTTPQFEFDDKWIASEAVPTEIKDFMRSHKNPVELAQYAMRLRDTISKRADHFSAENWRAYDEAVQAFRNIPAQAADYKYEFKADEDKGVTVNALENEQLFDSMKEFAHQLKLDNKQAQELFDGYNFLINSIEQSQIRKNEQDAQDKMTYLKSAFGQDFEKIDGLSQKGALALAREIGTSDEEMLNSMTEILSKVSPKTARLLLLHLSNMGQRVRESARPGYVSGQGITKSTAKQKYHELLADPDFMSHASNPNDPKFKASHQKLESYKQMAYN